MTFSDRGFRFQVPQSPSQNYGKQLSGIKGRQTGGVSNGGVSRSGLVLHFLSIFVLLGLSRYVQDFPDLPRDSPGISPICPFALSWPTNSTYEEQFRKGPRHNPDLSRKKVGNPPVWKPPGFASLKGKSLTII